MKMDHSEYSQNRLMLRCSQDLKSFLSPFINFGKVVTILKMRRESLSSRTHDTHLKWLYDAKDLQGS